MALVYPIIDFLLEENKKRPIVGDVLFIGKQETFGRDIKYGPETRVKTMDWSPHFGADYVHDLGKPVFSLELGSRFDFIYDGGSLDNMFNPAQGIMNMSTMLKPGGRMLCLACASSYSLPYTMFSPGWFHDYFEVNNYESWKTYLCSYKDERELIYGPWAWGLLNEAEFLEADWNRPAPRPTDVQNWLIVALATKGPTSTNYKQPIQYQYRPKQA